MRVRLYELFSFDLGREQTALWTRYWHLGLCIEQEPCCIVSSLQGVFCDTLFLPRGINADALDHYASCVSLFQIFNYLSNFHKSWHAYWAIRGHSKDFYVLGFCDRASWANCELREKTNKMQQLDVYYQHFLNMFRASLCPSSGDQDVCCCTWCAAHHVQQHTSWSPEDEHNDARNMLRKCW